MPSAQKAGRNLRASIRRMNPAPNLFLIGPMGAGKTTIGKRIAEQLGMPFHDLDHVIEENTGATIPLIFELEGEAGFRRRECAMLAELAALDGIVLATGGGAVLDADNRAVLAARGFVVYLETTVDIQLGRLARDRKRPLLAAPDRRERLEQMAGVRNPLYRSLADLTVISDNEHAAQVAGDLAQRLQQEWQRGTTAPRRLDVALGERSYPIWIGPGVLADAARWRSAIRGRQVLVVSNETVAPLYLDALLRGLQGLQVASVILPDGEQHKTLARCAEVLDALATLRANRDACVIALGGGVIGDMAGFAAACWMRGVDFLQVPTTLLAQVDSSVGGKTGVNLPAGKNLVGAFHQPRAVVIDTDTLATLPAREYRAGLAEVIKYGAIGDAEFFAWLEQQADALASRDAEALTGAIARSCLHKAGVVARDEREEGERALLNFGHTFGHALETAAGYGTLLHGEAVAIGMVLAARLSARLGRAPAADAERLAALLQRLELPVALPAGSDADALLRLMYLDKKNLSGHLRLILWRGLGAAEIAPGVADAAIRDVLQAG
jgi:3-dehydroquinate synthase